MSDIINAFLSLVRAGLWDKDVQLAPYGGIDYGKILDLATEQSLIGIVSAGLEKVRDVEIPREKLIQFIGQLLKIEQRNMAMNAFICSLISKLRMADIYTILVKGQGIAQCYLKPEWRACGDVDLFLSEDNYAKAKEMLVPLASTVENEYEREKHLAMTIDGWVVELHGHLYSGLSSRIEKELDDVFQDTFYKGNVRFWSNSGVQVFQLGIENDVFYVFTHILQHFYKEGVGLRQVCDWCRLMWTYDGKMDVEKLKLRINRAGIMSEWRAFYTLASKYLGMPDLDSEFLTYDSRYDRKADRIMKFVLQSGNMGHNRDSSYMNYPYVVRKFFSLGRRIGDLFRHARIFPLDSLRFSFPIMWNGVRSVMRCE